MFLQNLPRPIERPLPLVAIFLNFLILWGGGGYPPPGRAKVAQTPGRARVKSHDATGPTLLVSPRTAGGSYPPLQVFFSQIAKKTAAHSAAKFAIAVQPTTWHIYKKKNDDPMTPNVTPPGRRVRGSRKRIPGSDPKDLDPGSVRIIDPTLTVCRQIHWDHRSAFAIRQEIHSDPRSETLYCVGIHRDPISDKSNSRIFCALLTSGIVSYLLTSGMGHNGVVMKQLPLLHEQSKYVL